LQAGIRANKLNQISTKTSILFTSPSHPYLILDSGHRANMLNLPLRGQHWIFTNFPFNLPILKEVLIESGDLDRDKIAHDLIRAAFSNLLHYPAHTTSSLFSYPFPKLCVSD